MKMFVKIVKIVYKRRMKNESPVACRLSSQVIELLLRNSGQKVFRTRLARLRAKYSDEGAFGKIENGVQLRKFFQL